MVLMASLQITQVKTTCSARVPDDPAQTQCHRIQPQTSQWAARLASVPSTALCLSSGCEPGSLLLLHLLLPRDTGAFVSPHCSQISS